MKTPDDLARRIEARLKETWTTSLLTETSGLPNPGDKPTWPYAIPLGRTPSTTIANNFSEHIRSIQTWRAWGQAQRVEIIEETRHIGRTPQQTVTHVLVPDIDTAAAIAGPNWTELLSVGRTRIAALRHKFPQTTPTDSRNTHAVLRAAVQLSDLDFEILIRVADWFRHTPRDQRAGLTPRQVPLEGVHAKWLNTHQPQVRALAGLADLDLAPPHPARAHFTYLDPEHLDNGGRKHDSYSVGDVVSVPYEPSVVLISENKDTAIGFGRVPGGIAIEGNGSGAGTVASIPWVKTAPLVVYWGDMDIDGLEILDEYRASEVPAVSMFMNIDAYHTYQRYGTNHDRNGKPLSIKPTRTVSLANIQERQLYELLLSGDAPVLRIEQERIPLECAEEALRQLSSAPAPRVRALPPESRSGPG